MTASYCAYVFVVTLKINYSMEKIAGINYGAINSKNDFGERIKWNEQSEQRKKTALIFGHLQVDIVLKKGHLWTDINFIVRTNIGERLECAHAEYTNFIILKKERNKPKI